MLGFRVGRKQSTSSGIWESERPQITRVRRGPLEIIPQIARVRRGPLEISTGKSRVPDLPVLSREVRVEPCSKLNDFTIKSHQQIK